MALHKL